MNVFLISDTHFNHKYMVLGMRRPCNYKEIIIHNWNKLVTPKDTVIHLGDVIFSRASELKEINSRLNGTKILIKGNHDHKPDRWYLHSGFSEVHEKITKEEIFFDGEEEHVLKRLIFTHEPIEIGENEYNIHGHMHTKRGHRYEEYKHLLTKRHILISCEGHLSPIVFKTLFLN